MKILNKQNKDITFDFWVTVFFLVATFGTLFWQIDMSPSYYPGSASYLQEICPDCDKW
jgi:hypothetical protein